jgi:hypothetical protein
MWSSEKLPGTSGQSAPRELSGQGDGVSPLAEDANQAMAIGRSHEAG